jgi:hypothetical protein
VSKETPESLHQAARQKQIDGLTRMHARVIRAGEFSKDDLIQLLAQARATLELERKEAAGMVSLLPKVAVAAQKRNVQGEAGIGKNAATNAAKNKCKQALINDPAILKGNSNMNAARILSSRRVFKENISDSADGDRRKGKANGSLTIKQVAAWIGRWKVTGEI